MKKIIFLSILAGLLVSGIVCAADTYVVQSVSGRVEKEVSPGKWEALTVGASLNSATVLNTGIGANLVLKLADRVITIKAMQKGTLESLAAAHNASGIRIGGKISSSNIAISSRAASGTSTASTRADDMGDMEWSEE